MSTLLGDALIRIRPDMSGFEKETVGSISGVAKKAAAGFAAAFAAVKIKDFLGDSVSKASDFSQVIKTIGVTTGETAAGMESLRQTALDFGQSTVFSATDASDAMLALAKGGLTTAQIKAGALAETLTLASAGGLELGAAADYITQGLNTFGLGADQASQVSAALAGAANASTASVESVGQALSQVGPSAKLAGLSIQETTAAIAAFDNSGIKGSDAGTSLKTMLQRLVPATKSSADAMSKLGLKFTDASGSFLPLRDIAEQLRTNLKDLSEEQRTTALTTIFGADAFRAAAVLSEQGAVGIDKFTSATSDLKTAQDLAAIGTTGFAGAMEQFKGTVETLQIQLGEKLLPILSTIVNFGTNYIVPGVATIATAFYDAFTSIAGYLTPTAEQLTLITDAAKQVFTVLTTGDAASGPLAKDGPVVKALQDIKGGFDTLAKTAGETFDVIKTKASEFGTALSTAISDNFTLDISKILPSLVEQFSTFGAPIVEAFKKGIETGDFSSLGSPIGKAIAAILDSLVVGADGLFNVLKDLIGSVNWGELALELGRQVPTLLLGLVTGILSFDMGSFFGFIADNWFLVLMGVLTIAFMPAKFIGKIAEILAKIPIVGKLLGWLLTKFKDILDPIKNFVGRMFGKFFEGLTSAGPGLLASFGNILKTVILRIIDFAADAVRWFTGLPGRFETALGQGMVKLGEFVSAAFKLIWGGLKSVTLTGLAIVVGLFLTFAQNILDAAAWAFGWIPGIGDKLNTAADGFRTFRDDVNKSLTEIEDEDVKVNVDTTGKVTYPEGFSALGQKVLGGTLTRAGGGAVFGPGSGTSDSINARLSNGEFVVKADSVRKLGLGNLNEINQTGQLPGYAVGGIFSEKALNTGSATRADVGLIRDRTVTSVVSASAALFKDIAARALAAGAGPSAAAGSGALNGSGYQAAFAAVLRAFPQANLNSGYRPGDPGYHGQGLAVDLGQVGRAGGNGHPYLAAMNRWIHDTFPNSRELIYDGLGDDRPDLKNGRPLNYGAATSAEHQNHVHWVPPGFKNGGLFDPKLYDNGGILENGHAGVNRSGRPEAVLDPEETRMFKTLVANGGNSGPLVGSLTLVTEPGASINDQLGDVTHRLRVIQRGGGSARRR